MISGIEMKNFTNMFCRLIGSLRDSEFICHEFLADAMQIKSSFHKMAVLPNAPDPDLLIDDDEVRNLLKENEEMKMLLADYHRGVELLMAAYRQRVLDNMLQEQIDTAAGSRAKSSDAEFFDPKLFETIIQQSEQIYQMHNVIRSASNADGDAEYLLAEQMAFLQKENQILKELYVAAQKFGTAQDRVRFNELSLREIGVQTEKIDGKTGSYEQVESQCTEQNWESFERWKQQMTTVDKLKFDSEDEDEVTVINFKTHDKSKPLKINQKNSSAQAYTF